MDNLEFGSKIRSYRKEKGMSMQALAAQIGITSSMLSQIERNLANPSINTLKQLSNALEIPLFHFFTSDGSQEDYVVHKDQRKHLLDTTPPGTTGNYELLTPNSNGTIEFMIQRFAPSENTGDVPQTHIGEEVDFILEGSLILTIGSTKMVLNAGDSARIPAQSPHVWSNPSSTQPAALLFALTPPCF